MHSYRIRQTVALLHILAQHGGKVTPVTGLAQGCQTVEVPFAGKVLLIDILFGSCSPNHVVIQVIDQNYDINDVVTANLANSQKLSCNSGEQPGLRYK